MEGTAPTAHFRYRSLQQLFNWLVDEEEIDQSPMARMKPPIIPEEPVEVVSDEDLRRLLKSVEGRDFVSRRDNAAIRLWLDTGMRRGELGNLTLADLDFDQDVVMVLGKGRRTLELPVRQPDFAGPRPVRAHPRPPSARSFTGIVAR